MNCDYSPYSLPTIDFVGGSTQELVFHTFFSQNKKPFDLSSCTASFALINFVNKNGSPLIAKPMEVSKSEDGDGTVTNVLRVVLLPEETGLYTALVLSGVTDRADIKKFPYRPQLVLNGVGDIPDVPAK